MVPSLRIDFGGCFLLALGLLLLPVDWLVGIMTAAVFHEFCHFAAARLLKVRCHEIRIGIGGIVMELAPLGRKEEILIAAAGPAGSFLLLFSVRVWPQIAFCGLVQGIFNLLPVWPLDGGRMIHSLFADKKSICDLIEIIAGLIIFGLGIWLWLFWEMGLIPVLLTVILLAKAFLRKIPCKEAALGVQ